MRANVTKVLRAALIAIAVIVTAMPAGGVEKHPQFNLVAFLVVGDKQAVIIADTQSDVRQLVWTGQTFSGWAVHSIDAGAAESIHTASVRMQRADELIDVTHRGVAIIAVPEADSAPILESVTEQRREQLGRGMVIIEYETEDGSVLTAVVE